MAIQNKTLLKMGGIIILGGLFVFSIIWSLNPNQEKTDVVQKKDEKITIKTEKGEVQTNNFYQSIVEKSGNNYALEETKDFDIVYYDKDQTFFITIYSSVSKIKVTGPSLINSTCISSLNFPSQTLYLSSLSSLIT